MHLKELLENWSEDGVINIVQTFCNLKEIGTVVEKKWIKYNRVQKPTTCNQCMHAQSRYSNSAVTLLEHSAIIY